MPNPMMSPNEFHENDPGILQVMESLKLAKDVGPPAKKVVESLEKCLTFFKERSRFSLEVTTDQSETCKNIEAATFAHDWQKAYDDKKTTWSCEPDMVSGQQSGQFIKSLVSMQGARRILDVGMFTGYSALSMAEALPEDGEIVTLDIDEYLKEMVENSILPSPHRHKIRIVIGQAIDSMRQMAGDGERYDVIFLDASKDEYEEYLKLSLEGNLLNPGGTILVDNAFYFGEGYMEPDSATAKFGNFIGNRPDLHVALVPLRDGIYIIRRRSEVDGGIV